MVKVKGSLSAKKKTPSHKSSGRGKALRKTSPNKKANKKAAVKKSARRKGMLRKKTPTKKKITSRKTLSSGKMTKKTPAKKKIAKKTPTKKKIAKKTPTKKKIAKKTHQKKRSGASPQIQKRVAQKKSAAKKKATRRNRKNMAIAITASAKRATSSSPRHPVNLDDVKLPKGYTPSARNEYMGPEHLLYFRNQLQQWREDLVTESQKTLENLRSETRDVGDEAERASRESENILELRTRDRYRKLLKKIDDAIKRIEDGSYGYCLETGEEIGVERLMARPIAEFTVDAQERRELFQRQFRDDR